jgi:hypothetical protein
MVRWNGDDEGLATGLIEVFGEWLNCEVVLVKGGSDGFD